MVNYDFLYNKEYYSKELEKNHKVDKKLHWIEVNQGYCLPYVKLNDKIGGGIVDANKEYLPNTALHFGQGVGYSFDENEVAYSDDIVVYCGMWAGIWGHCITDNIRRLWFLKTQEYKEKFSNCKLVYIPFENAPLHTNFIQMLSILGVNSEDLIPITQIHSFAKIIIPDECFWTEDGNTRYFTTEYQNMIQDIRNYAIVHKQKLDVDKFYFTYAKSSKYKQIGEQRVERFFANMGYEVIAPEKYTFYEQLNILANCKCFASTIGSCSHNIIFLTEEASVYLIPRAYYLTGYQLALDEVQNLNITYIDSSLSVYVESSTPWKGPYYYYISDELLKCFSHVEIPIRQRMNIADFKLYKELAEAMNDCEKCIPPSWYQEKAETILHDLLNKEVKLFDGHHKHNSSIRGKIKKAQVMLLNYLRNV